MIRTSIQFPLLKNQDATAFYAQRRPYREGGNRIDKEQIQDKCIVHNYGHGGAGVSLAPGSAMKALQIAANTLSKNKNKKIAIIGSGIIGLTNALFVLNQYPSAQVTIYAEKIPVFGEKNNSQLITSEVAPGFWLPYSIGSTNQALLNQLSTFSFNYYQNLRKTEQYKQWIKEVEVYDISDEEYPQNYYEQLTADLKPSYKQFKLTINNKITLDCKYFKTIKIDMQPFLQALIGQLKRKGVIFVEKKITYDQLLKLPQKIIFNCTGLGSCDLITQKQMKGIKGHLIEYRNPNPGKYDYFLNVNIGKQMLEYYMHPTRIILGRTNQSEDNSVVNMNIITMLLSAQEKVFGKLGLTDLKPKL